MQNWLILPTYKSLVIKTTLLKLQFTCKTDYFCKLTSLYQLKLYILKQHLYRNNLSLYT